MSNHSDNLPTPEDFQKLAAQLAAAISGTQTRANETLETISAIKGPAYAMHLAAVAGIANIIRTTNQLICHQYPDEIVEEIAILQSHRLNDLIEPFFMKRFPEDYPESVEHRHRQCELFQRDLETLLKQRDYSEQQMKSALQAFNKSLGLDSDSEDGEDH